MLEENIFRLSWIRTRRRLALTLCSLLVFALSCGSDDTTSPPTIVIDTNTIVIGSVLLNTNYTADIPITNTGSSVFRIKSIDVQPAVLTIPALPFEIDTGATRVLSLTLNINSSMPISGTIILTTNAGQGLGEIEIDFEVTTLAYEKTQSGWTAYEAGNYTTARDDFNEAIGLDANWTDAHTGAGWSDLRLDDLISALANFEAALDLDEASSDAHAGKAFTNLNLESYGHAIESVDAIVTISGGSASTYSFSHDSGVDQDDLLWIKARAHFLLGQYANAHAVVDVLDPINNLDTQSATYLQDLAGAIEDLRILVL